MERSQLGLELSTQRRLAACSDLTRRTIYRLVRSGGFWKNANQDRSTNRDAGLLGALEIGSLAVIAAPSATSHAIKN
jgi:hypothetical protein